MRIVSIVFLIFAAESFVFAFLRSPTDTHGQYLFIRGTLMAIAAGLFEISETIKEKNFRG